MCTLHSFSRLRRQLPLGGSLGAKRYAPALVGGRLYRLETKAYFYFRRERDAQLAFPSEDGRKRHEIASNLGGGTAKP